MKISTHNIHNYLKNKTIYSGGAPADKKKSLSA